MVVDFAMVVQGSAMSGCPRFSLQDKRQDSISFLSNTVQNKADEIVSF